MPQYFTHYWTNKTWQRERRQATSGDVINHTASNLFLQRGVAAGDIVYIVTNIQGKMFVCGKIVVGKVCGPRQAAKELKTSDIWDARDHILASESTPMRFDLRVPDRLVTQLRFIGDKPQLTYTSPGVLDEQTLRGVRRLEPASALLLDSLLPSMTIVSTRNTTAVTKDIPSSQQSEDSSSSEEYLEGAQKEVTTNVYERDRRARQKCLDHYGYDCVICGFNFQRAYGVAGRELIHVHHIVPLAERAAEYTVDPIKDLRPVCPNCHLMIHSKQPAYTIAEMKALQQS